MNGLVVRMRRALVDLNKRIFTALRSDESQTVIDLPTRSGGFADLRMHKHCLVVTYRKDGTPIAQPVWPGYDGDRIYLWTEVQAFKAKRLRRNPNALIAPCSFRGKPLGLPVAALGRVLETAEERAHAEATIRAQWGWKRRAFAGCASPLTAVHYIVLVPTRPPSA